MFAINVLLTVKNESDIEQVGGLLADAARLSRAEPGCLVFEACHSQGDPRVFILVERWDRQESWEIHKTAKAFTEIYQPRVLPLVERVPHFCDILE